MPLMRHTTTCPLRLPCLPSTRLQSVDLRQCTSSIAASPSLPSPFSHDCLPLRSMHTPLHTTFASRLPKPSPFSFTHHALLSIIHPLTPLPPPHPPRLTNVDASGHLYGVAGGSGGYAEAVLRYAALELFGVHVPPGPLEWQQVRNADMRECSVAVDRQHVLRVACAYGFRNIQNVLRRAKQGRCPYHYVEVMACPGGESGGVGSRGAGGGGESRMYQYHHVEVMACPRGEDERGGEQGAWRSWLAPEVRGGAGAGGVEVGVRERDRSWLLM
ncbi:unnamed protein product [Closterium sp. NIES-54]